MTRCIIIPADQHDSLTRTELASLEDLQRAIGGWLEEVQIDERFVLLVDEEGRMKGLPQNRRATLLLRLFVPAARNQPGLVGTVVIIGTATETEWTSVPEDLERLLIDTPRYVVRAVAGADHVRSTPFDSFWDATEVAIVADVAEALGEIEVVAFE